MFANVGYMPVIFSSKNIADVNLNYRGFYSSNRIGQCHWGMGITSRIHQDSIYLLGDTLIITPAIRNNWTVDTTAESTDSSGNTTEGRDVSERNFTPQIGVSYTPTQWITLRSNAGRYVRQPSFFELFGDRGFTIGNDELKEERGENRDIGGELRWSKLHKHLSLFTIETSYFRNTVEDLITQIYDARGVGKSVNVSGAQIKGYELSAQAEFLTYFRAIARITKQTAINNSDVSSFNGKVLPGIFQTTSFTRLEARVKTYVIYAEIIKEREMFYDTANLLPAEDKKEYNAGFSVAYKAIIWNIEGRNLGDNLYEELNGYPLPGRSFYTSISYLF